MVQVVLQTKACSLLFRPSRNARPDADCERDRMFCLGGLYQTTHPQVLLDDNIIDGRHHESDLCCICRACEMCVDLLGLGLVERDESIQNVVACRVVVRTSLVVGEVVLHRRYWQLLLESVDLVQEEDDAGLDKPP